MVEAARLIHVSPSYPFSPDSPPLPQSVVIASVQGKTHAQIRFDALLRECLAPTLRPSAYIPAQASPIRWVSTWEPSSAKFTTKGRGPCWPLSDELEVSAPVASNIVITNMRDLSTRCSPLGSPCTWRRELDVSTVLPPLTVR